MNGPFYFFQPTMIPLWGMLMVVLVVAIVFWFKAREKELQFHQDMRIREMEHERRLKEMEVEKARLELEKARTSKGS